MLCVMVMALIVLIKGKNRSSCENDYTILMNMLTLILEKIKNFFSLNFALSKDKVILVKIIFCRMHSSVCSLFTKLVTCWEKLKFSLKTATKNSFVFM